MSAGLRADQTEDQAARAAAVDPRSSVLVQAPAGSGKTDLLTMRYLALLTTVADPEQILAITFTRKATAEMRARVLAAFAAAERGPNPDESDHQLRLREYAAAALAHGATLGWQLQSQPQRLNIQTIDSLALSIAHQMPLLSRLGGQLNPIDDARAMYALAAERTMALLGNEQDPALAEAISEVLRLRDASLADCESLIAQMLGNREQWLMLVPGIAQREPDWDDLRRQLEAPFRREHAVVLVQLQERMQQHLPELLALARTGVHDEADHLSVLSAIESVDEVLEASHWQSVCKMLLTEDDGWRKTVTKRHGFPSDTHRAEAQRLKTLISSMGEDDGLLLLLCRARALPPPCYSDQEWRAVRSIFTLLRRAMAELRVVFAEHGTIDFAEASIAAHAALAEPGVQMRMDDRIRHILVDEFQDTSRTQLSLLRLLLQDWQQEDGRTCFFVGDPMQSIYLFRAAEASLFGSIRREGLQLEHSHLHVTPLTLLTNFRSTPAIVEPINEVFSRVLVEDNADAVGYAPALSSKQTEGSAEIGDEFHVHILRAEAGQKLTTPELTEQQANQVLRVIKAHQPAIEQARRTGQMYRVAVLARTRAHLLPILKLLRHCGIPFRGVKIEPLAEQPEILDLLSLLRALLHPADRIAWLSVLRAPWCGLTLPALHALCGDEVDSQQQRATIPSLLRTRSERLPEADRLRALHVLHVLEDANAAYAHGLLSTTPAALSLWLERTWHALAAPAFLKPQQRANAEVFFRTLGEVPAGSMATLDASFNRTLDELYAEPDPTTSERSGVQVMTIHGAKGLEFEVTLVPALERNGRAEDPELFRSLVRRRHDEDGDELLLAPIGRKQDDKPGLYRWVDQKMWQRLRQEDKRLLYVACSRAIRELHLFATVEADTTGGVRRPRTGSLLAAGWEGLAPRVQAALAADVLRAAQAEEVMEEPADTLLQMPQLSLLPLFDRSAIITDLAASVPKQTLRRLPQSYFPAIVRPTSVEPLPQAPSGVARHDRHARIRGTVLHALLAHAAASAAELSAADPRWSRMTDALLRQRALRPADQAFLQDAILSALSNTFRDQTGRWLLRAEPAALNEASFSSLDSGAFQRHRPDRIFLAGAVPGAQGEQCLWIVDYKTGTLGEGEQLAEFAVRSRAQYMPQLESYSRVLRASKLGAAEGPHRLAIYYPALPYLDWWPA